MTVSFYFYDLIDYQENAQCSIKSGIGREGTEVRGPTLVEATSSYSKLMCLISSFYSSPSNDKMSFTVKSSWMDIILRKILTPSL